MFIQHIVLYLFSAIKSGKYYRKWSEYCNILNVFLQENEGVCYKG